MHFLIMQWNAIYHENHMEYIDNNENNKIKMQKLTERIVGRIRIYLDTI